MRRWAADGTIERVRIGRRVTRYRVEDVDRLINAHNDVSPDGESGLSVTTPAGDGGRYEATG